MISRELKERFRKELCISCGAAPRVEVWWIALKPAGAHHTTNCYCKPCLEKLRVDDYAPERECPRQEE